MTAFTGTSASCRRTEPVAKLFREGEVVMEVLSSRVLLQGVDFERSFRFYAESLGLHVYREWGRGSTRGVVFFLGGGFLELSGSSRTGASVSVGLWLTGARRGRRRRGAEGGRSGYYRAPDRQAMGVARDAVTRSGRVEDCDRRGVGEPPAPAPLSCVLVILSAAIPSFGHCGKKHSYLMPVAAVAPSLDGR